MAAIRSHLISLFSGSGAVFPDRKWWLSCFCLPHSKEEKPARQHPPTERPIYTIQTSHDDEPKTEFSGVEEEAPSVHEVESHWNGAMEGEAPLANGFRMQLLDSLSRKNHLRDASVSSFTETHEVDDVVDVALPSISENITEGKESSLSCCDTQKPSEDKESLTDIQLSVADNDRDTVVPDVNSCPKELVGDQSAAGCLISSNPMFPDLGDGRSSPGRQIQPMTATVREIREHDIEVTNEVISENTDDDGLKFTTDLAVTSSSDHSFKSLSNLETSGIQSNLSSLEDSFVQSSTFSENGTMMQTSDEDSEPCFRTESSSHDLLHASVEMPAASTHNDNRQEIREGTSALPQLIGMVLSENMEKPFDKGNCSEPYNGITGQDIVLVDNHACDAVTLSNNSDKHSLQFEVERAESDASFQSKCDATEGCAVSEETLQHVMQDIAEPGRSVASDVCLTTEQAAEAEVERTSTGIAVDSGGNSAEIVNISAKSTGNAESTIGQLRPNSPTPDNGEAVLADESSECGNGNYYAVLNNCGIKDQALDAYTESMKLHSLLQTKLLFRPDSYETLERLVDGETMSLLGKALDEVLTVRKNRETLHGRKGLGDSRCEVTVDEIKAENGLLHCDELSIGHQDPFNLPKSNVFQEIVIENFEQLFDNEEWLDDDFGFSSDTKSEFQRLQYSDRIISQQDYSREAFHSRDFELEDDFLPPDLQSPVIQLMPETLFPLVDQATDIFWSRRRYGEPVNSVCPPETYFSAESRLDNVDSCSQRSHETFVFHLVAEILQEIYSDELTEVPEPWQRVHNFKPKFVENPPTTVDVLKPLLHSHISQWLKFEKGSPHEMTKKGSGLMKQLDKKDIVDRLLIKEMYQEEPSWTDYSQDANLIKNRVANKLFLSLIEDTVQAFKFIQSNALTNKCQ